MTSSRDKQGCDPIFCWKVTQYRSFWHQRTQVKPQQTEGKNIEFALPMETKRLFCTGSPQSHPQVKPRTYCGKSKKIHFTTFCNSHKANATFSKVAKNSRRWSWSWSAIHRSNKNVSSDPHHDILSCIFPHAHAAGFSAIRTIYVKIEILSSIFLGIYSPAYISWYRLSGVGVSVRTWWRGHVCGLPRSFCGAIMFIVFRSNQMKVQKMNAE